ncbi:MAG: LysR family transcriptional regulator [Gammaproteobacteria bacterium]|nr:LysR family transcriptional regulator [Gammaproteobacteria bacterium]
MKHNLPPLDSLKVFESAARHLSFSLAADELCISKGAVSYQIRKLEQTIDCALFRRTVRQVYLTDAGQKLLQTTRRLFDDLGQTLGQLTPGDSQHNIYISATTYVAMRWLSPRIAGFSEQQPEVSIVLQHTVNSDDFKLQDVDITIQWATCNGKTNHNRLLEIPMPLYPVCSPEFLHRLKLDKNPAKLRRTKMLQPVFDATPLLCEDRSFDLWQAWFGEQDSPLANPRRIITDANVRTQAAIDGQGWTMADALMQAEIDRGELVAPFRHRLEGFGYVLMSPPGRYLSQKVKALQAWLVAEAG